MAIVWVQRDGQNMINGVYANRQAGLAEEQIDRDHPDVVAYLNPPADQRVASFRADASREALLEMIKTSTLGEIDAWVDANAGNLAEIKAFIKQLLKLIALDPRE